MRRDVYDLNAVFDMSITHFHTGHEMLRPRQSTFGSGKQRTRGSKDPTVKVCSSLGLSQSPWWIRSVSSPLPMMIWAKLGKYIITSSHLMRDGRWFCANSLDIFRITPQSVVKQQPHLEPAV